ncbi:hypothetical protein [Gilliamella sp. ESL0250]|nr:hypothetical protein [Gilliamella sp. ESL0250]
MTKQKIQLDDAVGLEHYPPRKRPTNPKPEPKPDSKPKPKS